MAALWKEHFQFLVVTNFIILFVRTLTILACIPKPLYHGTSDDKHIEVGSQAWLTNHPLLSIASRRLDNILYIQKVRTNKPFATFSSFDNFVKRRHKTKSRAN